MCLRKTSHSAVGLPSGVSTTSYIYMSQYIHIYIGLPIYIQAYSTTSCTNIRTYIHTYVHACIHACIHAYIHTYIHTLYIHYAYMYGSTSWTRGVRAAATELQQSCNRAATELQQSCIIYICMARPLGRALELKQDSVAGGQERRR